MKASELRIGNYVNILDEDFNTSELKVDLNDMCNIECDIDNYVPIPLTEEWLIKFGFKEASDKSKYGGFLCPGYNNQTSWVRIKKVGNHFEWDGRRIDYVHKLQNLYFALTGEELTTKQQ